MPKMKKEALYERLTNVEDARACEAIADDACKNVPSNFIFMLVSQILSKFADALLNPKVTLPWLMQGLGVPSAFVAWLVPIRESGSLLPQLAIASYIRKLAKRKWIWVSGALVQALCIVWMLIISLNLSGAAAGAALIAVLCLFSMARGFCSVAAKDILGKVIPKGDRGNLSGLAASITGFATLVFAFTLWLLPERYQSQAAMIALGMSALMWMFSALCYSMIIEHKGATQGGKNGLYHALSKLKILYQDRAFAHFVLTRALLLCSALSAPFYIVLASNTLLDIPLLALFMAMSGLASFVSAPFWGRLSDLSSKHVLMLSAFLVVANGIMVFLVSTWQSAWLKSVWFLPCMYFLLSVAHQGARLGRKTYLVNMAEGALRTDYVSVSNTVIGGLLLILGSLGLLTTWLSISELILVYSLLGLFGAVSAAFLKSVE